MVGDSLRCRCLHWGPRGDLHHIRSNLSGHSKVLAPWLPKSWFLPCSRTALPFLTDGQTKSLEKDGSLLLWVNIVPQFWSTNSTLGIQLTEICRASQCWVLSDAEDTVKTELQDCITHSRQMSKDCSSWKFQGHIHYWVTLTKHVYESISCPFRHMNYAQILAPNRTSLQKLFIYIYKVRFYN